MHSCIFARNHKKTSLRGTFEQLYRRNPLVVHKNTKVDFEDLESNYFVFEMFGFDHNKELLISI